MDELYREYLLDNYKNPQNLGMIKDAAIHRKDSNPLCGDEIEIFVQADAKGKISDVKFTGTGCVICIASASILTSQIKGKNIKEVANMQVNDMSRMLGIDLTPTRIKCMMLPLKTMQKAIIDAESTK